MTPDWTPLETELARWADLGLSLPLWWRDDDAISDTQPLDRLAELSGRVDLPVHLAVIPRTADASLAAALKRHPQLLPVVHGWAHRNHAPPGEKKAEFGAQRPLSARVSEIRAGADRLRDLFGDDLRPVFVPPWNRIADDLLPELPGLGFAALSTFGPRPDTQAAPGLARINTHLDPIDWRGSRSLVNPDRLIHQMSQQLADRREGRADAREPYGLLTHHLVHDAAIWDFTEQLLTRLTAGPIRVWTAPRTLKDMP